MIYDYELALVLSSSLSEQLQKKTIEDIKLLVLSVNGKIKDIKLLGKKKFCYPIKKQTEGFYHILTFALEGNKSSQISNKIQLNENVLRYLVIRQHP